MNKLGQFITTVVIGAFAVALVAMVVLSSGRAANPVKGSFATALAAIKEQNLQATALSPADVYGDDWVGATVVCPGATAEEVASLLQVNPEGLHMEETVPDNKNYLVVVNVEGDAYAEGMDRADVDLCSVQILPAFDAKLMVPLIQNEQGAWMLSA